MRATVRPRVATVALAACLGAPTPAEAGPPAQLAQARYVALGYDRGDGFVSETDVRVDVLPEEREALQRIRAGLEQWDRYQIVVRPGQAELLIAVRKGRLVSVGGGINVGGPPSGRAGRRPGRDRAQGGVQVSSPDDMIELFDAADGSLIWRGMKANGLSGAGPPLTSSPPRKARRFTALTYASGGGSG